MSRVRKIKVDGVIVSHSEQGTYISVTTSGTLYDAKCLTSIGVNALFKELERVSDWRERLQGELAELSNTNRTLTSTAASLQSKLNASQDEVSEFVKESVKHDEYACGLRTTNSMLDRHIIALDAKIAEQDKLINGFREFTANGNSLIANALRGTETELIDTIEKLAVSEQEREAMRGDLGAMTESCRLACSQRDLLNTKYAEVSEENAELRSDDALNVAEGKIARLEQAQVRDEIYIKELQEWVKDEDRRIWAQFVSALMVAGTKGMSESMVVEYVDGMLRMYKTRFPTPCVA